MNQFDKINRMTYEEREEYIQLLKERQVVLDAEIARQWKSLRWLFLFIGISMLTAIIVNTHGGV